MSPFDLRAKLLAGACLALLVVCAGLGVYAGKQVLKVQALRVELADLKASHAEDARKQATAYAKLQSDSRKTERELQGQINRIEGERDDQIASATVAASELLKRLRAAQTGTATAPAGGASAATGATAFAQGSHGAVLRGEAEALVREAERADILRAGLAACYAAFDKARAALKGGS